jgi:hypothetical protein
MIGKNPVIFEDLWKWSVGVSKGLTARVRFPALQDVSLLRNVQTDSGANPATYPRGTVGFFPEGKTAVALWLTSI